LGGIKVTIIDTCNIEKIREHHTMDLGFKDKVVIVTGAAGA
jgi:hypothetical protein